MTSLRVVMFGICGMYMKHNDIINLKTDTSDHRRIIHNPVEGQRRKNKSLIVTSVWQQFNLWLTAYWQMPLICIYIMDKSKSVWNCHFFLVTCKMRPKKSDSMWRKHMSTIHSKMSQEEALFMRSENLTLKSCLCLCLSTYSYMYMLFPPPSFLFWEKCEKCVPTKGKKKKQSAL